MVASAIVLGTLFLLSGFLALAASAGSGGNGGGGGSPAYSYAIVQFGPAAVADYTGGIAGLAATKPLHGQKLDLASAATVQYEGYLSTVHANYRAWLKSNAPWAQIVREYSVTFDGYAVALNGHSMGSLQNGPAVASVTESWVYQPAMDTSVPLIHANDVWTTLGYDFTKTPPVYGDLSGLKVGVIDSGIMDQHPFIASCRANNPVEHRGPFFSGLPFGTTIVNTHGTHVAGTIGGCKVTTVDVDGVPFTFAASSASLGYLAGVAPGVTLVDYNVFPGMGVGYYILDGSAFSHDIMAAVEQAVLDGMDVINLSISGGVQGPHDLLADAVNSAVDAGVVAAVAAGNAGPGLMTVGSPGTAANAITAGASTDPHFFGIPVTFVSTTYGAVYGAFAHFPTSVSGSYAFTTPENGCSAITNSVTGGIAVIKRGTCSFSTKIRNAQSAGATGAIIWNNIVGDPVPMAQDGTPNQPTIPAAMISLDAGTAVKAANPTGSIAISGTSFQEFVTAPNSADIRASFSSAGPTPYTFLIKPDVMAPGLNVLSSVFTGNPSSPTFTYEFFQGTSMATPHVTGSAVLVLAEHPNWDPSQVKSALVNTAHQPVKDFATGVPIASPLERGAGRVNVQSAATTPLLFDPVSASFGLWTGGEPVVGSTEVTVTSTGPASSCTIVLSKSSNTPAGAVALSTTSLSVSPGASATFSINLNGGQTLGSGLFYGEATVSCGSLTFHLPWFVGVQRSNGFLNGNMNSATATSIDSVAAWIE